MMQTMATMRRASSSLAKVRVVCHKTWTLTPRRVPCHYASTAVTTRTPCIRFVSSSTHETIQKQNNTNKKWIPSLLGRLVAAFGMIHVVSEYGVELTLCEGPSMMPTILPRGEIILVDRFTPRLFGLQGGCNGKQRAQSARSKQEQYTKKEEWHDAMICVNELPTRGVWKRFWTKCTTGIHVGDVVVVQHPDRNGTVCKRVLGLPGDTVVQEPHYPSSQNNLLVIPHGHLWLEGDNTMNSSDSRNYGPVPAALIVGRVLLRLWPLRGNAMMERGARPLPPPDEPFSGSTVLPAGYEGETIVRTLKGNE